ncbi:hypothetical protein DM02DRAFT_648804 [Periconia macrospinosa]|uniref:Uncharacterized protein n=1 Tax=Periconia macrospinosa TaxID=97972 RepID=A0A2V1EAB3_9PLEO|nr:hypothetical protein DM02DRAFT_648804 [Periconia macrospinosa]
MLIFNPIFLFVPFIWLFAATSTASTTTSPSNTETATLTTPALPTLPTPQEPTTTAAAYPEPPKLCTYDANIHGVLKRVAYLCDPETMTMASQATISLHHGRFFYSVREITSAAETVSIVCRD